MNNHKTNKHDIKLEKATTFLIIYIISSVFILIIIKYVVFENEAYSLLTNEGWASFLGSYVGGVLGGLGTLLAMYLTLKNTIELQEENKKDTEEKIAQNNYLHNKEYQSDKIQREKERREDEGNRRRAIRIAFADDIAEELGRYLADISKYHYASVLSGSYYDSKNQAYSEMTEMEKKLKDIYMEIENSKDLTEEQIFQLAAKQKRFEIEYETKRNNYYERKKECENNSNSGNRIIANECFFTLKNKLIGVDDAEDLLSSLQELHSKSSTLQDKGLDSQIGNWLENITQRIIKEYDNFRKKYIDMNEI